MQITSDINQTVAYNQNVLFNETVVPGNKCIIHREGSGLVTLKGITNQAKARFQVFFSGNVGVPTGGTAAPTSVAIAINGEPDQATNMVAPATTPGTYTNASSSTSIEVPRGCCYQISVKNTSESDIGVSNANLIVTRTA